MQICLHLLTAISRQQCKNKYVEVFNMMIQKDYSSPVLKIVSIGQTDVITASNNEAKDVLADDFGVWYD